MSAFEEEPVDVSSSRVDIVSKVVIDGLAVLKIVKHCNDNFPTSVSGILLGLDLDGILEVSYTFPTLSNEGDGEEDGDGREGYQIQMMQMLEKVNVDNNMVGWYQTSNLGSFLNSDFVDYQTAYQSSESMLTINSIVIIYDPYQSKDGRLVLKAFRLSDKFMEMRQKNSNDFMKYSDILVN